MLLKNLILRLLKVFEVQNKVFVSKANDLKKKFIKERF